MTERFNGPYTLQEITWTEFEQIPMGAVIPERRENNEITYVMLRCPCQTEHRASGMPCLINLPVHPQNPNSWGFHVNEAGMVTFMPSINMLDPDGCRSHYFIRNGMVEWC